MSERLEELIRQEIEACRQRIARNGHASPESAARNYYQMRVQTLAWVLEQAGLTP